MAALRAFFDDPRWPMAFALVIAVITTGSLLAHRGRTRRLRSRAGSRAQRPWPVAAEPALPTGVIPLVGLVPAQAGSPDPSPAVAPAVLPHPAVPEPRSPLPDAAEPPDEDDPVGTLLLVVTPGGPVAATRPAELLDLEPGLQVRIRRADLDPAALFATLPDEVAIPLDDLSVAPTCGTRNAQFRSSVWTTLPRPPCAVILAGPAGGTPVVAVTTIALEDLFGGDARLAALLARASAARPHPDERRAFDTALLAAARSHPVDALIDLDGLRTDGRWLAAHGAELRARYGSLLGTGPTRT